MSANEIDFIQNKGGTVLLYNGYRLHKHVAYKNHTSLWRCDQYKASKLKCSGAVSLDSGLTRIIKEKPHIESCVPDNAYNSIEKTLNTYCNEAVQGKEPAPRVYKKALNVIENKGWYLATEKSVPSFNAKKSAIYRQRNKFAQVNQICAKNVAQVQVPVQFKDFLLDDYSRNEIRIIAFSSEDARTQLKTLTDYFMDGTFRACPKPFKQLFVIQADIGSDVSYTNIVPLVYVFMSHRTIEAYTILFNLIKSKIPEWNPRKVTIDFEKALMYSLTRINVEVTGCHYHFCNALIRKSKALDIKNTKPNRRIITLCCKLPLLPETLIEEGWNYIKAECLENEDLRKFIAYFENYWMKDGYFSTWCVFGLRHRTNNSMEGWNHKINSDLSKNQTNLLQVLHLLRRESALSALNCNRIKKYGEGPIAETLQKEHQQ